MKKLLIYMTALLMLTACSSSDDRMEEPQPVVPGTEPAVTESESDFTMLSFSRANRVLTVEDEYSSIGVFLIGGTEGTQAGQFRYRQNDHRWHSSLEVTNGQTYRLYGYGPADVVTAAISDESADGVTMTFSNLPSVSSQDICFVVGVQHMSEVEGTKDIKLGKFLFEAAAQDHNFINLLMDHLYAGLQLKMTIDTDYAQLRSIRIRKLELQSTNTTSQATVVLLAKTDESDPVQSVTYSGYTGTGRTATFFESTTGVELTVAGATTPTEFEATCCFVPTLGDDLTLVTTYDVFDKNRNKIAERTASNKLPNFSAARGERVKVTMNVKPTYLYVLSDPDLDNPTITIGN